MFKIYPIPEDTQSVTDNMIFKNIQPMHKEECILRVYIVRGIDLQSKDSNGKVNLNCILEFNNNDKFLNL